MKLKTITGGFRIELYIQGTEARHGSLGTKSYQKAIYNTDTVDSTANRLVVVLDFGGNKTATNGTFTITFPDPTTPANAIISMS